MSRVLTVTLNPAIDQTLTFDRFTAGAVNRVRDVQQHAGGKGVNVAALLASLGTSVVVTGWLGDRNAAMFERLFAARGISDHFVRLPGETRVGLKLSDAATGETTDINFPGPGVSVADVEHLLHVVEPLVRPGEWTVLGGSAPVGADVTLYARLVDLVRRRGGLVAVDTSGDALRCAIDRGPDLVKPNLDELGEWSGRPLTTMTHVITAARSLLDHGVNMAVISMGGEGALLVNAAQTLHARPPAVPVRSTVGAGDAMMAGLVYGLAKGWPLDRTARLATALGADAVTRVGASESPNHTRFIEQVSVEPIGEPTRHYRADRSPAERSLAPS